MYGWACDNVVSFEVVLADGSVVTASPTQDPDLYKALRGGGPNFGIVTNFKLRAFPYTGMWGGLMVHDYSQSDRLLKAFMKYGVESEQDPRVSIILNFGMRDGSWCYANDVQYCSPTADVQALKQWMDIPALENTTRIQDMSAQTVNLASRTPRNWRNSYWALSTKLDFGIVKFYVETFIAECERVRDHVKDFHSGFDMQVITTGMLKAMSNNGGNCLGLTPSNGPLLLYNPVPRWSDPADDHKVYQAMANIVNKTTQKAKELGVANDFLYMNYASQFQDVVSSYGEENVRFLRELARRYDPQQVFQRLQNYFPLGGPVKEGPVDLLPHARGASL